MFRKILFVKLILLLHSCNNIDFVYNNIKETTNPLYNKTIFQFTGDDLPMLKTNAYSYFGNAELSIYELVIDVSDKKTKRSVQDNQVVDIYDHEISYKFSLYSVEEKCVLLNIGVGSSFTYTPKSGGLNFASDENLVKLYDLSSNETFQQLINLSNEANKLECLNEG